MKTCICLAVNESTKKAKGIPRYQPNVEILDSWILHQYCHANQIQTSLKSQVVPPHSWASNLITPSQIIRQNIRLCMTNDKRTILFFAKSITTINSFGWKEAHRLSQFLQNKSYNNYGFLLIHQFKIQ